MTPAFIQQPVTGRARVAAGLAVAYGRDGYAVVRGVLDGAAIGAAHAHLASLRARVGAGETASVVTAPVADEPFFMTISGDARLTAIVATIMGEGATPFGCTYIVKAPGVGLPVLWHQDGEPWRTGLGITDAVTLWLALDDATPDNGCLRVVPGSHRRPAAPLRPATAVPNVFGHESDPGLVDASAAVHVPMVAGDVSVHHPALVHGSDANRSARPRTALALRYRGPR